MDGNVSNEGIRKDMEWMQRAGIGGFQQFDAGGIDMPRAAKVKLPYMSEGWKDSFRFALQMADSLGMEVGIASAPGWSSTGGTWVTPDDAMKKLEWRTMDVKGGKVKVTLPELFRTVGPYQDYFQGNDRIEVEPYGKDLFVLAVRLPKKERSMKELKAEMSSSDSLFTVRFRKPQTIRSFTLKTMSMGGRPRNGEPVCRNVLECSDDGLIWNNVTDIYPVRIPYATVDIEPTTARWFRVRGEKIEDLELHTVTKVNHSEELGGFSINLDFNKFHTPETNDAVAPEDVIDITECMDSEGNLSCTLPRGRWRIYRFGWSITGKINHPASPEATGLEVDKLDSEAWSRYIRRYLDIYKEAAGGMLGNKGITHLLTDSYEAGSYTWTPRLRQEFLRRRGYDMMPWIPVLTGQVVGSSRQSEGFLWDWRKTLGELIEENYDSLEGIMEEYGLAGRYTESHEGGRAFTGDGMDLKKNAKVPMAAIWMENTPTGSAVPSAVADIKESSSVAHIFGQGIVAAESFSVNGDELRAYTYCPENMKYIADVALGAGLNRYVIHESASQPSEEYLPGLQLFRYGQWFHRNETWAEYARYFTDYLARSCFMLQQGKAVADILVYYGEDSNVTAQYGGDTFNELPQVPAGYEYDFANPTVLLEALSPVDGTLKTRSGMVYKVLWLDRNCETMSLEVIRKIAGFADKGVVICGKEPTRCAGLQANDEAFNMLVASIWHSGRSNVVDSISDAVVVAGLEPDFKVAGDAGIRYVHRSLDGKDIYWVRNFSGNDGTFSLSFRSGRKYAAMFNPEKNLIVPVTAKYTDGRSLVSLPLLSTEAEFIVFSDVPFNEYDESRIDENHVPGSRVIGTIDGTWSVHFKQKGGQTADETFDSLHSWTECENPVVRYFAGTAVYRTTFEAAAEDIVGNGRILLDLGEVKNIAEVYLNGKSAGVLWKAPFRAEVTSLLQEGTNTLEIKVTNLWANRQIGDVQPGEKHPVTAIRRFYKASDPLLPSGLLGPARLVSVE